MFEPYTHTHKNSHFYQDCLVMILIRELHYGFINFITPIRVCLDKGVGCHSFFRAIFCWKNKEDAELFCAAQSLFNKVTVKHSSMLSMT